MTKYKNILNFIISDNIELAPYFSTVEIDKQPNYIDFLAEEIGKKITLNTLQTTQQIINKHLKFLGDSNIKDVFFISMLENVSGNTIYKPIDLIDEMKFGKIMPVSYIYDRSYAKESLEQLFSVAIQDYVLEYFSEFKDFCHVPSLEGLINNNELTINMEDILPSDSLILIINKEAADEIKLQKTYLKLIQSGLIKHKIYKNGNKNILYQTLDTQQTHISNLSYNFTVEQLEKIEKIFHSTIKELSLISKYLTTYQIIEMLIDMIFHGLIQEIKNTQSEKINSWQIKNLLSDITSESYKITQLINSFLVTGIPESIQTDFINETKKLISQNPIQDKISVDTLAKAIYFVRNTFAHAQREININDSEQTLSNLNNIFTEICHIIIKNFDLNKGLSLYRTQTLINYV